MSERYDELREAGLSPPVSSLSNHERRVEGPPDRHGRLLGQNGWMTIYVWPGIECGVCSKPVKTPKVTHSTLGVIHGRCSPFKKDRPMFLGTFSG